CASTSELGLPGEGLVLQSSHTLRMELLECVREAGPDAAASWNVAWLPATALVAGTAVFGGAASAYAENIARLRNTG
ncbi:MAG: hypothetical protein ABL883_13715, partial [Terricaulis sp.]